MTTTYASVLVRPDSMTPRLAAASRSGHSADRHGAVLVFHPSGGDAHPGHPLRGASMRWRGPIRQPPGGRYEQGQPAPWREQHPEKPADRGCAATVPPATGTKPPPTAKPTGNHPPPFP